MTDTHMPPQWKARLRGILTGRIEEVPHEVDRFLEAWQRAEGGTAKWNPLNTTLQMIGSTNYNTKGVKNYTRPVIGIAATAVSLVLPTDPASPLLYGQIVGFIQAPGTRTAEQAVELCASQIHTWGTDPAVMLSVLNDLP